MNKALILVLATASAVLVPHATFASKVTLNADDSLKIYKSFLNGANAEDNSNDHFQVFSARVEGSELACDRVYSTEKGVKTSCNTLARDRKGLRRFKIERTNAQIISQILDRNTSIPKNYNPKTKSTSITVKGFKCDKDSNSKKFKPVCIVDIGEN